MANRTARGAQTLALKSPGLRRAGVGSVSLLALCAAAPGASAEPAGGVVARGAATIERPAIGQTTITQSTPRAIIDWRGFDVGARETVRFRQPDRSSATLNRVRSGAPTTLAGEVTANGTVIVQNPSGVTVSRTARVNTGGFVATTKTVDADRFMRDGRLVMEGGEARGARIRNEGRIVVRERGLAALVGSNVSNDGLIEARLGTVALAAGRRTTIDLNGDGLVRIAVDGPETDQPRVANAGTLSADGGRVLLTAEAAAAIVGRTVNTTGAIRARDANGRAGTVEVVARGGGGARVAGAIDVSGPARGGAVTVTGPRTTIASTARIDARGGAAGGTVRVGGDVKGGGATPRARTTEVAKGAAIDASSARGAGGSVVVWADGATRFDGTILARGGPGAAGGFVETSGKERLAVGGSASVATGAGGTWWLDPRDVTIRATGGVNAGGPVVAPTPGAGIFFVNAAPILAALNGGTDVTITTEQAGTAQSGILAVEAPLNWSGSGSLTLRGDDTVYFRRNVTSTGSGSLTAQSVNNRVAFDANVELTGTGSLLAQAGGDITFGANGNRVVRTASGALTLQAGQDVLIRRGPLEASQFNNVQVYATSGPMTVIAGRDVRVQGVNTAGGWARLGRIGDPGSLVVRAGRDVALLGGTPASGNRADAFGEIVKGAGGSIAIEAGRAFVQTRGAVSQADLFARGGASLSIAAPTATVNGRVVGTGDTRLAGAFTVGVAPLLDLNRDRSFALTAGSSVTSSVDLRVTTSGAGRVDFGGPLSGTGLVALSENVVSFAGPANMSRTGEAILVRAENSFVNTAGPNAFSTPNGRFLVYSTSPDSNIGPTPGPAEFNLYGRNVLDNGPAVLGFSGSRMVYRIVPTLTLTADTLAKTYGDLASVGFTVTGLRTGDRLADALLAAPVTASLGAPATAPVGVYATAVTAAASAQGYRVALVPGALTVTPAPLAVTANPASRLEGEPNPPFSATFDGLRGGDTAASLGTLLFSTDATPQSPVGTYAIVPFGLASGNYAIVYRAGALTIRAGPAPPPPEPPVPPVPPVPPAPNPPIVAGAALAFAVLGVFETLTLGRDPDTPGDAVYRVTPYENPFVENPSERPYPLGVANAPEGVEDRRRRER